MAYASLPGGGFSAEAPNIPTTSWAPACRHANTAQSVNEPCILILCKDVVSSILPLESLIGFPCLRLQKYPYSTDFQICSQCKITFPAIYQWDRHQWDRPSQPIPNLQALKLEPQTLKAKPHSLNLKSESRDSRTPILRPYCSPQP